MSIRNTFPTIRPSLNLDFARSRTLDPRITFSRTTTGTYMDSDGLIKVASADEARFDHRYVNGQLESLGLLVEESRSNIILYSVVSTTVGWSINSSTLTNNATTAPDGTNTAARIQVSGGGYVADLNIPVSAGTTYTFSFWLKSVSGSGTWGINIYDHATGVGHNRTTVNITEEWQRVSYTYTPTGTLVNVYVSDDRDNLATISDGYVWGAQLEAGSFMTSLIPTSGDTASRGPDKVSIEGENFSDWYNSTEGTVLSIFNTLYEGSLRSGETPGVWGLSQTVSENNTFNGYGLAVRADTRKFSYAHRVIIDAYNVNVSLINSIETETIQPYTKYKVSCSYADNELKMSPTGQETLTRDDANYGLLPKTTLFIGFQRFGGSPPYELTGHISKLSYYPRRLSNSELQNLTK